VSEAEQPSAQPVRGRGRLFRKYVTLFVAVVAVALLSNGLLEIWFSYQEHRAVLIRIQREQADAAATKISQFVKEIESQIGWTTQLPWSAGTVEQRRFDALRLLRQVPAITELAQIDAQGREQLRVSRLAMDVIGGGADYSRDPKFTEAVAHKVYYGPVYFRRESEPYMTLALAGTRRDSGVSVAEVNLKFIWDVVSQIKVGKHGQAYVVDSEGRLIAHPDISLVLRNTDLSNLTQVKEARAGAGAAAPESVRTVSDVHGREVLAAHAPVPPLRWYVFVELPADEAYAPLYASIERSGALLLGGLALAFLAGLFLARRMVVPIQALRAGAARIGGGDLGQRISIKTGDELESLADQFNDMAGRLQDSYATLERRVVERTQELSESLERQTASADILRAIASAPGEADRVLQTIAETAHRLFGAYTVNIATIEGESFRQAACTGPLSREHAELTANLPVNQNSLAGRVALEKRPIQVDDLQKVVVQIPDSPGVKLAHGARSVVAAPLLRENEAVGAIVVARDRVQPFTEKQTELLETFAAQAVIAIENTRLLTELRETLERQTAMSDVLGVISSSPGDLGPVFDTILDNAIRLCEGRFGVLFRYDGDAFHAGALREVNPQYATALRGPLHMHPDTALGRMVRSQQAVHIADLPNDAAYRSGHPAAVAAVSVGGVRTLLAVPMLKERTLIGAIAIYRGELRPFTAKQIELVESFAAQAVIAVENARLLNELRESLENQTASADILRAIASARARLSAYSTRSPALHTICSAPGRPPSPASRAGSSGRQPRPASIGRH